MRLAFLLVAVPLVAPTIIAAQAATDGAALFKTMCASCHGENGVGAIGPQLRGRGLSPDRVSDTVKTGRPGTIMPSFGARLSPAQLAGIVAYVSASPAGAAGGRAAPQPRTSPRLALSLGGTTLMGNPSDGEHVFFAQGAYRCAGCHSLGGRGAHVGPDLSTRVARLTPQQLLERIIHVSDRKPESGFEPIQLETKGGQLITGVLAGETRERFRVYDTSTLPATLLEIPKKDVAMTRRRSHSVMPPDYASRLSLQQLVDVVAFLKSN